MIQKNKPFKAVSMPCTEEQFNEKLKPILEFLEVKIEEFHTWEIYNHIATNYNGYSAKSGNINSVQIRSHNRQYHPEFCAKAFIEALGYDYEGVIKAMNIKSGIVKSNIEFNNMLDEVYYNSPPTHYKILRPILFFAESEVVHHKTLRKYFTKKAVKSLIKHEYIK